jgi:N-methylhydantoinase A
MMVGNYQIGIDIGGTFTDVVIFNPATGRLTAGKMLTSSDRPAQAVIEVIGWMLAKEGITAPEIGKAIHGTTLVTNLIIERKGAKTGLLTTDGFRDALEIGRETRYDIYDIFLELPKLLVPRRRRIEISERLDNNGRVLIPLARQEVDRAVKEILSHGVEAVAVSLLHSFRNPAHEQMLRDTILAKHPGVPVSISSDVVAEVREYERTSTTVANAYAMPMVRQYLTELENELTKIGLGGRLYIMLSTGGIASPETATRHPIRLLESGPAAGAIAAAWIGKQSGSNQVLSFDMGGTTAKTCIIENGVPVRVNEFEAGRVYRFKKGSGLPIKIPVIEMIEIGAGGGSIATIGPLGLLKVGPESAGANPGPSCYGLGGKAPTVTDADLILGYLDPDFFLGGDIRLDVDSARKAMEKALAFPTNLTVEQCAWGIHEVVNENMANAARIHAVEKGLDPREFSMVAFGGAGPVHAYQVARKLRLKTIIIPPGAGVCSAFGFLLAPMAFDLSRSYISRIRDIRLQQLNTIYTEMETEGRRMLLQAGIPDKDIRYIRTADMRYIGQGFDINVSLPNGEFQQKHLAVFRSEFEKEYRRIYQRLCEDIEIECVNWRLTATGPHQEMKARWESFKEHGSDVPKRTRKAYIPGQNGYAEIPVYDRYRLSVGTAIEGPAIIEERESTLVMNGPGKARLDTNSNVIVQLE